MREAFRNDRNGQYGFTLIELIIVIGLIGILIAISTFAFNQMQNKSRAEAQVREMVTDISEVRIRAITLNQRHSLTVNANSYVFKSYSTDTFTSAVDLAAKGTVIPGGTHNVKFPLRSKTVPYAGSVYEIDTRGMIVSNGTTIFLSGTNVSGASVNCLTLHTVRVNSGKENPSGDCDDR